ncbi:MAG TPA: GIY-YIG nuclease family protein [Candidatus Andersenbacteria bacterium]|nr:GIY-YIG nuclease family protein [Candidatus Andersenbacteria bacterium]
MSGNPTLSAFASPKSRQAGRRRASPTFNSARLRRDKSASMNYVYILKCSDNRYYVGCTNNLKDRINRHEKGHIPATVDRLPVELTHYSAFLNSHQAFAFEKYLKSGSGRSFMKRHLV